MQGPDNIRSQSRNPKTNFIDYDATFDFLANVPESNHAGTMFFSDSGHPDGWNFHGYGCHTFSWVNKQGKRHYIKYTFKKKGGQKFMSFEDVQKYSGINPDYSKKDMWDQIENAKAGKGEFPEWTAYYQIMTAEQAEATKFDAFDVTKVWPRDEFPLNEFGRVVLNKNPDNYHRDTDQAAFSPSSLVPGIEASPDMLLQWRMFFYRDAQMYRIGSNVSSSCDSFLAYFADDHFRCTRFRSIVHSWPRTMLHRATTARCGSTITTKIVSTTCQTATTSQCSPTTPPKHRTLSRTRWSPANRTTRTKATRSRNISKLKSSTTASWTPSNVTISTKTQLTA